MTFLESFSSLPLQLPLLFGNLGELDEAAAFCLFDTTLHLEAHESLPK